MDNTQVATAIKENLLNLHWIDEVNSDLELYDWTMEDRNGDTFIDIIINMEHAKEAWEWYDNLPLDTGEEDEQGETISILYDDSKEVAKLRGDDVTEENYEWPEDKIEICLHSQTHLKWLAEACIKTSNHMR